MENQDDRVTYDIAVPSEDPEPRKDKKKEEVLKSQEVSDKTDGKDEDIVSCGVVSSCRARESRTICC
jgi:hypothetical protein